jgi:hypothetical protein
MLKVKPQSLWSHKGSLLVTVIAQNITNGKIDDVRCRVVVANRSAAVLAKC